MNVHSQMRKLGVKWQGLELIPPPEFADTSETLRTSSKVSDGEDETGVYSELKREAVALLARSSLPQKHITAELETQSAPPPRGGTCLRNGNIRLSHRRPEAFTKCPWEDRTRSR